MYLFLNSGPFQFSIWQLHLWDSTPQRSHLRSLAHSTDRCFSYMGEYGAAGDFAAMTIGGEDNLLGPFPLLKVGHVTVRLCNYSGSNRLQ